MSDLGNKNVMAENLKYYIEKTGKDRRAVAEDLGVPYSTLTEWLNGRKYPRIDRIEKMAKYFDVLKSDLIEKKTVEDIEKEKDNDALASIIVRMRTDVEFFEAVKALEALSEDKLKAVHELLGTLFK